MIDQHKDIKVEYQYKNYKYIMFSFFFSFLFIFIVSSSGFRWFGKNHHKYKQELYIIRFTNFVCINNVGIQIIKLIDSI